MNSSLEASVAQAAAALGWVGDPIQVRMCGETAWAIASLGPNAASPITVAGVVVAGGPGTNPTARASVFASFCPRAVLVPNGPGVLSVQMDAAVLDQGVVVVCDDGRVKALSPAGPRVARAGAGDSGYRRLLEQVHVGLSSASSGDRAG